MILVGCDVLLDGLARADLWIADGTFSVVPSLFYQLYTIHFEFGEGINPVGLYCLMRNKTNEVYTRMLTAVKNLIPAADRKKILVDIERAAITAFETAYPAYRQGYWVLLSSDAMCYTLSQRDRNENCLRK